MLIVFLKLLLAHIIGDFVLQPNYLVQRRRQHIGYLLLHVLIHAAVLCLLFYTVLPVFWIAIVFISVSHLAVDSLKIWIEKIWNCRPIILFLLDQLLHLLVLIAVVFYEYGVPVELLNTICTTANLLYLIAFLLITVVSPIFLRVFFTKWNEENDFVQKKKDSLLNAGLLIGIMERLIIVLFIQVGFLSGIGFLLAAKSIFRFGDLTNAKDTKFTEYILVGTLASFLIAIFIGYMLRLTLTIV